MSEPINFVKGSDTGESGSASIQPYADGQPAVAATFNRPTENLRARTETLRGHANETRMLADLDRTLLLTLAGSGGITWGGTSAGGGSGELVLGAATSLRIIPIITPGSARSRYFEGPGAIFPSLRARAEVVDGTNTLRILSDKQVWQGGNQITFTVTDVPGSGVISVNVSGTMADDPSVQPGIDDIVVTYDSASGHTIGAVLTAINAEPVASALVTVTQTAGAGTDPMFEVATVELTDGLDGVFHDISAANLAGFFAASADNALREGDTLAIWYDSALLRRQSTEAGDNHEIPSASLVNLTREPEKGANCVPIGKVLNDEFLLASGVALAKGATAATLSSEASLRTDLAKTLSSTPSPGSNSFGSEIIGVNTATLANSATVVGTASAQKVFEDLDAAITTTAAATSTNASSIDALLTLYVTTVDELADVDSPGDAGSVAQLIHLYDPGSLNKTRYTRYNRATDSGATFATITASADTVIDVCGTRIHAWDGTTYRQINVKTGGVGFSVGLSDIVALSSNGSYTALVTTGAGPATNSLLVYNNSHSGPPITTVGVGVSVPGAGEVLGVAMRADDIAWVVYRDEVTVGDHRWFVTGFNVLTGATVQTLEMFAGTSDSDYTVEGFDVAPGCVVVAVKIDDGDDTRTVGVQTYDHLTATWGLTTHIVGDGLAGTRVNKVIVLEDNILVAGEDLGPPQDLQSIGANNALLVLSKQEPSLGIAGSGALLSRSLNASSVVDAFADGDRIYAVMEDQTTGDSRTVYVFDNTLNVKSVFYMDVSLRRILSDGQYLWTLDINGAILQHVNDVTGGWYRYDTAGREPLWTRHVKLGHGK